MKGTRDKIIDAAKTLFEQKGYAAATTKQIASLAGVSEVTVFRHFCTKRQLFDETIHSCLHPYHIEQYLKSGVTYDLSTDLRRIAYDFKDTFQRNTPLLHMVMRDKVRQSTPAMAIRDKEHNAKNQLLAYFTAMRDAGRLSDDPQLALDFFITNITGYLLKELFADALHKADEGYFEWMLGKVISTLAGKDSE